MGSISPANDRRGKSISREKNLPAPLAVGQKCNSTFPEESTGK